MSALDLPALQRAYEEATRQRLPILHLTTETVGALLGEVERLRATLNAQAEAHAKLAEERIHGLAEAGAIEFEGDGEGWVECPEKCGHFMVASRLAEHRGECSERMRQLETELARLRRVEAAAQKAAKAIAEGGHPPDPEESGSCVLEYPCPYRDLFDAIGWFDKPGALTGEPPARSGEG